MKYDYIKAVKQKNPLVHNITNYVTVNDCANILLGLGASPIMADDIGEVEEIVSISNALVINIGTLNDRTIASMIQAGKKANEKNIPVILDPVGAGASKLRTATTFRLLKEVKFSVIRGNSSEIKTVYYGSGTSKGVDADSVDTITEDNRDNVISYAKALANQTGAIIAITGAIDIVADLNKAYVIRNGHPLMSKITGTGCMLTSILGAMCGANQDNMLDAAAAAVCAMGICGEVAVERMEKNQAGTSSLKMYLIDTMSTMEEQLYQSRSRYDVI